jgi:hypothetical protein
VQGGVRSVEAAGQDDDAGAASLIVQLRLLLTTTHFPSPPFNCLDVNNLNLSEDIPESRRNRVEFSQWMI